MEYKLITKTFLNHCFDKRRFQNFLYWIFKKSYFGQSDLLKFLEKLKFLGFHSATEAGFSISIEDLVIPPSKSAILLGSENMIFDADLQYISNTLTTIEKYQRIIDIWSRTSEKLKIHVLQSFQKLDFFNPVYLMTFSGARGNISQIKQLIGMRGLMADPLGKIIDFPIRSNFREGLTLIEYLISCSGARKGVVDTALRTAASGYLTRRLVDVAHHVIISQIDCQINYSKKFTNTKTQKSEIGIYIEELYDKQKVILPLYQRLIGRISGETIKSSSSIVICEKNHEISKKVSKKICQNKKKILVRSPLSCQSPKFICQLCYGWNLAEGRLVSIGEAVGILAAQSIGEPGTQLTMRTFHTGGIFTGTLLDQTYAPFSGYIYYNSLYNGILVRTLQGRIAFLSKNNGAFKIISNTSSINDIKKNIFNSFKNFKFFSKKQIFSIQKNFSIFKKSYEKNLNSGNITNLNISPYKLLFFDIKNKNFFKKNFNNKLFNSEIQKLNLKLKKIIYFNFNWLNNHKYDIQKYYLFRIKKQKIKNIFISKFTSNILHINKCKNITKKFAKKEKTRFFHFLKNDNYNKQIQFIFQKSTLLYTRHYENIVKTQLLAELPFLNVENFLDTEQEILSQFSGELYFEDFLFLEKNVFDFKNGLEITKNIVQNLSEFWILFAKPFKNIVINKNNFFKTLDLIDKRMPFAQAIFEFQNFFNLDKNLNNHIILRTDFLQLEQKKINFYTQGNESCESYLLLNFEKKKSIFFQNSLLSKNFSFICNKENINFNIYLLFFKNRGYIQANKIQKFSQKLYKFYLFRNSKFFYKMVYNGFKYLKFNEIKKLQIIAGSFIKNIPNKLYINFETWIIGLQLNSKYIQDYSSFRNNFLRILRNQFQLIYFDKKFFNHFVISSSNIISKEISHIFFSDRQNKNLKKYFLEIKENQKNKMPYKLFFIDENIHIVSLNRQGIYKGFYQKITYIKNFKNQIQEIYLSKNNKSFYKKIYFNKLKNFYRKIKNFSIPLFIDIRVFWINYNHLKNLNKQINLSFNIPSIKKTFFFKTIYDYNFINESLNLRKFLFHNYKNFSIFNLSIFKKNCVVEPIKIKSIFRSTYSKNFQIFSNIPINWNRQTKKFQPKIINYKKLTNQKYMYLVNFLLFLNLETKSLYSNIQSGKLYKKINHKFKNTQYSKFKRYNLWKLKQKLQKIDLLKLGRHSFIRITLCFESLKFDNKYLFYKIYEIFFQSSIYISSKSLQIKKLYIPQIKKIFKVKDILKKKYNFIPFSNYFLIGFLKIFIFSINKQKKNNNNNHFIILKKKRIIKSNNLNINKNNLISKIDNLTSERIIRADYLSFRFDNLLNLNFKNFSVNFKNIHFNYNQKLNIYLQNLPPTNLSNSWEFFGDCKLILEKKKYSTYSKNLIQTKPIINNLFLELSKKKTLAEYKIKSTIYLSINELLVRSKLENSLKNKLSKKFSSHLFLFDQILPNSMIILEQNSIKKRILSFNIKLKSTKLKKSFISFYFSTFLKILQKFILIKNFNLRFLQNIPKKPICIIFNVNKETNLINEYKKNINKDLTIRQKKTVKKYIFNFYKGQLIKNDSVLENEFKKIFLFGKKNQTNNFKVFDFFLNQKNFYYFYSESISKKSLPLQPVLNSKPNFNEYLTRFSKSEIVTSKFNIYSKNKQILHKNIKNKILYKKNFNRIILILFKKNQNKKLFCLLLNFFKKNFNTIYEINIDNNLNSIKNKKLFRIAILQLKYINFKSPIIFNFKLIRLKLEIYGFLKIFRNIQNFLEKKKPTLFQIKNYRKFIRLSNLQIQLPIFEKKFEMFFMSIYPINSQINAPLNSNLYSITSKIKILKNRRSHFYQLSNIFKTIDHFKIYIIQIKYLNFYQKNKNYSEIQIIKKNCLHSFEIKIFIQFFFKLKNYEVVDPIYNFVKKKKINQSLKENLLLTDGSDFFSFLYNGEIERFYETKNFNKKYLFLNCKFFLLKYKSFYFFNVKKFYKIKKLLLINSKKFYTKYYIKKNLQSKKLKRYKKNREIFILNLKKLTLCLAKPIYFLEFSTKIQNIYLNINNENLNKSKFFLYKHKKYSFQRKTIFSSNINATSNINAKFILPILGSFVKGGEYLNDNYLTLNPGQLIAKTHQFLVFRKAKMHLLNHQSILYIKHGQTILKNQSICSIFYSQSKTGDIVQGIPKIEEIFESRKKSKHQLQKLSFFNKNFIVFEKKIQKYLKSLQKSVVNNIQRIYCGQGIYIADKHIEIIVRQITSNVLILQPGQTGLLTGEIVELQWILRINRNLISGKLVYEPILMGMTKTCLETSNFLSAASFQETTRILTKAAFQNQIDFICGLKQNVILGNLIPIGTGCF